MLKSSAFDVSTTFRNSFFWITFMSFLISFHISFVAQVRCVTNLEALSQQWRANHWNYTTIFREGAYVTDVMSQLSWNNSRV